MSNQSEFERKLAALIVEFKNFGVPNDQIREALRDHASNNNLDSPELRYDAAYPEKDYSFRKRIRATVPPGDKDLTTEVEGAIGAQLDVVGARCGLQRYPRVA